MSDLLADLTQAAHENPHSRPCEACQAVAAAPEDAKAALSGAIAGRIGAHKLSVILTRNGYPTGRRAIERHRRERHDTP